MTAQQENNTKLAARSEFNMELTALINKYSMENVSNTPDFILADYLESCLRNFGNTIQKRELFYRK